ncbi:hypothetical protein DFR70_102999 [Nocardia tenerifensis]|uniref:Uncharacterized protein n=1 Tax=Nocardia tenerifensis TaxID=228006 RepID=A0A318KDZ0_9NOCA|nr:hypothetical protein [Nocardia tenerifensis]PXX69310.1 hypothetical protein DFR70_102999 [Nocardia tenerifensis]
MSGLIAPAKVGVVLTAAAPITTVASAVHMAATKKPSVKDRRFKHFKTPGIGELWTVRALDPGAARRVVTELEPAMGLLVDAGGGLHIHAVFHVAGKGTLASFLAVHHDANGSLQIGSTFWWADALARRTAAFLLESDVASELETRRMRGKLL